MLVLGPYHGCKPCCPMSGLSITQAKPVERKEKKPTGRCPCGRMSLREDVPAGGCPRGSCQWENQHACPGDPYGPTTSLKALTDGPVEATRQASGEEQLEKPFASAPLSLPSSPGKLPLAHWPSNSTCDREEVSNN